MKLKSLLLVAGFTACISSQAFAITSQPELDRLQDQLNTLQHQVYLLKQQNENYQTKKCRADADASSKNKQKCRMVKHSRFYAFNDSVVIAPYTEQATFNTGDELIVNAPAINEDMKLLYRRYLEQKTLLPSERMMVEHPRLLLSGNVEAEAIYEDPYTGSHTSDINLSWAELDIFVEVSKWVNGFMALTYDDSVGVTPNRISNSNIQLDRGFLLFGNFAKSHWYGSIGQVYVPFGRYSSNMISDPLTKYIGKTKARAITAGYAPTCERNSPYGRVFVFQGASKYRNNTDINNGGVDLGFIAGSGKLSAEAGVSYIYNIADSDGMQNNGVTTTTSFMGFDVSTTTETIAHRVAGGDAHGMIKYGPFNVIGEYVSALRSFNPNDLSYNTQGAKPSAFNVEGAYVFRFFAHPSAVAIGGGASRQALALNIPKQRYYASWEVTILNNTKAELEYRHDKNYSVGDNATGKGAPAFVANQLGKTDNAVTARLDVYF